MHVRFGKKPVWIILVTILLASTLTISIPPPAKAQTTVLSVYPAEMIDETKTPGQSFTIEIHIADVVNLWGYLIFLSYNTSVLTATSFASNPIHYLPEPCEINDTAGYVTIAYHMAFGAPAGFTGSMPGTVPFPLATITFSVDDYGWSPLDLYDVVLSDHVGGAIDYEEADGYFANEIHDIAVTDVTTYNATHSPVTEVIKPNPVYVNVTVVNNGDVSETFDVKVTATNDNNYTVGPNTVTLGAGASTVETFTWATATVAPDTYEISATAGPVPGEPQSKRGNNTYVDGSVTVIALGPTAKFTYSPDKPIEYEQVNFNACSSTVPPGKTIVSWDWDFGDGQVGSGNTTTHAYDTIGKYPVTLNVTDDGGLYDLVMKYVTVYRRDVAVVSVTPQGGVTNVTRRGTIYIDVTVANQGNFTETFGVTTYYNETATPWKAIATKPVTNLANGTSKLVSFPWNTENASIGAHKIKAVADTIPGETDTGDNTLTSLIEVTVLPIHDVGIYNVTASPTTVDLGETVNINVTVTNSGDFDETFDVDVYYTKEEVVIEPEYRKNVSLAARTNTTLLFIWDTTNASTGVHVVIAHAWPVTNETVLDDNDVEFDGKVTILGHDVAVVEFKVTPAPILVHRVTPGEPVTIKVRVKNEGTANETFDVTVYYDNQVIGTQTVTDLANDTSTWLTFTWDTTGVAEGTYTIKAVASTVPGERPIDIEDNTKEYGLAVKIGYHDIAVTKIGASPTEVLVGESILIQVTVKNEGIFPESNFNVTIKYDDTDIQTQTVTYLADGTSTTLNFTWDTTDVTPGTYTIKAVASTVPGELPTDTADNTLTGPIVAAKVTSTITISANPTNITVGKTTTINGTITPTRVGATVTIWYKLAEEEDWKELTTVLTIENSQYSYDWKPTVAGTYEVKASWGGDASTFGAESSLQTIKVEKSQGQNFVLYAAAGIAIVIIAATILVYLLKFRKPKPA